MTNKAQRRNLSDQVAVERKKTNLIIFVILTAALIYISATMVLGDMGLIKYLNLHKNKTRLETEIRELEKENNLMSTQIRLLKDDPYYIEKHAREEFGLAKPDEFIFQFQDDKK
jgi:cell division protein FtsB